MRDEDILIMPAGHEMDLLIAKKVMGQIDFSHPGFFWTEGTTEDGQDGWDGFYCPRCGIEGDPDGKSHNVLPECVKKYSTNIAEAWEVVGKHPYYFSLSHSNDTNWMRAPFSEISWRCRFYAPGKFEAIAETAPLVICRAALLAIKGDNNAR